MPPALKKVATQLLGLYRKMSVPARVLVVLVLVGAIVGLSYVATVDHTQYATLFSGLATDDAARIVEALKKSKTPFKIEAGGTTIVVPAVSVHELRLEMAGQGLPRGGAVGFEIFDNQKFGVSDFAQQVNYRRALQGELERTIAQIDAVKAARVHIAMPERQLFVRRQRPVTASVTVRLRPGRVLSPGAARGVVHLVSSSVSGLSPDAVTVMDTTGKLLWGGREDGDAGGLAGVFERQHKLEYTLERRVVEILERALGAGRSVVKVTADVAHAQVEQTEEQYDPDRVAIRSESSAEQKNGGSAAASGVPGVRGNLPGGPAPRKTTAKGSSSKQVTRNYEVNKTVRRKILPAGELRRLSVAVLIDKQALGEAGSQRSAEPAAGRSDGDKPQAIAAAAPIDLKALENVVKQAVGFDSKRGDQVTVRAVPFAPTPTLEESTPTVVERVLHYSRQWVPVALGAFLALVVAVTLLRKGQSRKTSSIEVLDLPKTVAELEGRAPIHADVQLAGGTDDQARQLAAAAAEHDSARAAQVLRAWMGD